MLKKITKYPKEFIIMRKPTENYRYLHVVLKARKLKKKWKIFTINNWIDNRYDRKTGNNNRCLCKNYWKRCKNLLKNKGKKLKVGIILKKKKKKQLQNINICE